MSFSIISKQLMKATASGLLVIGSIVHTEWANAGEAPQFQITAPEGFENLEQDQTLLVDLFFGGRPIGETMVILTPDRITFLDVDQVLALLPSISDVETVHSSLRGNSLPANAHRACSPKNSPADCGRLAPDVVGVIVDRDQFRVEIFLNPRLLEVKDRLAEQYIPLPPRGLSLINSIGGVVAGSSKSEASLNFQDRLILASGNRRLRADFTYSNDFDFGAERIALEWDVPERRYSVGALWAPGNALAGRRKLLGVGLETQIDTREDKESILGSPVVVFLDRRARIDLIRDGRVLLSRVYEAGNQLLDTSSLPEGSYEIVLRIEEAGGMAREERRFFTKSRRIPALGRYDFFVFGGFLARDYDPGSMHFSDDPFVQTGLAFRLNENLVLDGGAQLSEGGTSVEAGLSLLTSIAQVRLATIAEDGGGYGTSLQLSSTGTSRFNYNLDFRRMRGEPDDLLDPLSQSPSNPTVNEFDIQRFGQLKNYTQLGGILTFSTSTVRMLGTLFYRDEPGESAQYSIGPSVEWDVFRKDQLQVTLRSDLTASDNGTSAFAGISLRLTGKKSTISAKVGRRKSGVDTDNIGNGAVAAIAGTWNNKAGEGEVALGAGYEHLPREDNLFLSSELRHPVGSLAGDLVHTMRGINETTQYAVGFQTTLVAGQGAFNVAGRTTTESMIVAQVDGAQRNDRFELMINEQVVGTIEGHESFALALPAYRSYKVRMRSVGDHLLSYDGSTREIGLYPGVVEKLKWEVSPITIKFGRLVDDSGRPIPFASIVGKGVWSETDELGYFQIEVAEGAKLSVTLTDGKSFAVTLPAAAEGASFAQLGDIACCDMPQLQVAALDNASATNLGAVK